MAFLIFEQTDIGDQEIIKPTGENFHMAGYNLIYKAWQQQGRPIDTGWHVSADELLKIQTNNNHNYSSKRLVIDRDPKATWRISLVELLDIYGFTWGTENGAPSWTPLMLRLRDVYYEEFDPPINKIQKSQILSTIPAQNSNKEDFIEFLYINGPINGWTWGRNGMTHTVFLRGEARNYFRQFF